MVEVILVFALFVAVVDFLSFVALSKPKDDYSPPAED